MEGIVTFFGVVLGMIGTILYGTIFWVGIPLERAIIADYLHYAPYYMAFCLMVALAYYIILKMKKR